MGAARLAAIDLGASSARLFTGRVVGGRLEAEEVARLPNGPVRAADGLHWNLLGIYQGLLEQLARFARASAAERLVVGIDGWAVDYGLVGGSGRLLAEPFHYRDRRTAGRLDELERLVGIDRLYEATGIQALPINTICQLLAEREGGMYAQASHLLLIPDLLAYFLTGVARLEQTNASTTQLVDVRSGRFVEWLFPLLQLRRELFAAPIHPGEPYGPVLPATADSVGLEIPAEVVAVASHDTASAVLGVPSAGDDAAFVVSGTWSLVGLELEAPVISEASRRANFSNEVGYGGTIRFLKNVMGHWMLQECERAWSPRSLRLTDLVEQAAHLPPFRSLVDVADPIFVTPDDMPRKVQQACAATGEPVPGSETAIVRCVLDSMALAIADALEEAARCAGRPVRTVHVVGGGAANGVLLSLLAATCGREIVAGPVEASAVGNLLVQLEATGQLHGRTEMRQLLARSLEVVRVRPDRTLHRQAERAVARWSALRTAPLAWPSPREGEPGA